MDKNISFNRPHVYHFWSILCCVLFGYCRMADWWPKCISQCLVMYEWLINNIFFSGLKCVSEVATLAHSMMVIIPNIFFPQFRLPSTCFFCCCCWVRQLNWARRFRELVYTVTVRDTIMACCPNVGGSFGNHSGASAFISFTTWADSLGCLLLGLVLCDTKPTHTHTNRPMMMIVSINYLSNTYPQLRKGKVNMPCSQLAIFPLVVFIHSTSTIFRLLQTVYRLEWNHM